MRGPVSIELVVNTDHRAQKKKLFILITTMTTVINSTMASSLPSNAIPYLAKEWGISSTTQKVLPISMFLIGEHSIFDKLLIGALCINVSMSQYRLHFW